MKEYLVSAIAALVALPGIAQAQTAYTDKATFLAAAGSTQTETFATAPAGNFASTGGVFNATFDGFNLTGQNNGNYVGIATGVTANSGVDTPIPGNFTGQNYLTWANIDGGIVSLTVNFNAATTAFGFDWFDTDVTDSYSVQIPGGTTFNSPPFTLSNGSVASTGFFGLVSANPFTSVIITNVLSGGYISDEGMDNFITNGAGSVNGAVPEPATWAMMLLGFGVIGFSMRSAKRRSEAKFDIKIQRLTAGVPG